MARTRQEFYTIPQLAKLLQVTETTIYHWMKQGKFETIKIGSTTRVAAAEVNRLITAHTRKEQPQP